MRLKKRSLVADARRRKHLRAKNWPAQTCSTSPSDAEEAGEGAADGAPGKADEEEPGESAAEAEAAGDGGQAMEASS